MAEQNEPADPLFVALFRAARIAPAAYLGDETNQQFPVVLADLANRALPAPFFQVSQLLWREMAAVARMIGLQLPGGIVPIDPRDLLTDGRGQELAIEDPYRVDALAELPARESVFEAYPGEVLRDLSA